MQTLGQQLPPGETVAASLPGRPSRAGTLASAAVQGEQPHYQARVPPVMSDAATHDEQAYQVVPGCLPRLQSRNPGVGQKPGLPPRRSGKLRATCHHTRSGMDELEQKQRNNRRAKRTLVITTRLKLARCTAMATK